VHFAPFRGDARQGVFKPAGTLLAPSGDHFTPKRPERAIGGLDIGVSSRKSGQGAISAALATRIDAETGGIIPPKLISEGADGDAGKESAPHRRLAAKGKCAAVSEARASKSIGTPTSTM
jgi:hypothetical protein